MSDSNNAAPQQETPWLGYLIMIFLFCTLIAMCSKCGDDADENDLIVTAPVTDYKPTTNISYRFLDKNEKEEFNEKYAHGSVIRRSYAYEITNFDKNNPECWTDLYFLAEYVAEKKKNEMMTMVYFFAPSDSLVLWHDTDMDWDISWSESQDSLWIGNYLRLANGHKEFIRGTNWK